MHLPVEFDDVKLLIWVLWRQYDKIMMNKKVLPNVRYKAAVVSRAWNGL